jgi:hypothetical protein
MFSCLAPSLSIRNIGMEWCVIVSRFRILIMGQCGQLYETLFVSQPLPRRTYVDFKTSEVVTRSLRT